MLSPIDVEDRAIKIEVFFVENVLLVIVCFLIAAVFLAILIVSAAVLFELIGVAASNFVVQPLDLAVVELTDILVIIMLVIFAVASILLLHPEAQVVLPSSIWVLSLHTVLLLAPPNCSYLIDFGSVCAWNDLAMLVLDGGLMDNPCEILVLLIRYELRNGPSRLQEERLVM